jgi:pilus assembly protein CpaE
MPPDALVPAAEGPARASRIPVVAFVRDRDTEAVMRDALADLIRDGGQVKRGSTADARIGLQQMETPGVLIVDVAEEADPITALEELAQFVEPGVRVLVVGDRADMEFYRQVTRGLGVLEYLCKPLNRDQVSREFLPWIIGRGPSEVGSRGGKVITVIGVRGGVGATTVAVNLAVELSEHRRHHTVLLDADLQAGTCGLMVATEAEGGLRAALENPERVDKLLVERAAPKLGDRLALLSASDKIDLQANIPPGAARHLIDLLRARYNCIVADMPRHMLPMHLEIMEMATQRVFVLDPTLPSLRDALRFLTAFGGRSNTSPPLLVLNRLGAPGTLHKNQVLSALQRPPDVIIPFLPKVLQAATTLGDPAVRTRGQFQTALAALAHEIVPAPAMEPDVKKARGLSSMMWGRK